MLSIVRTVRTVLRLATAFLLRMVFSAAFLLRTPRISIPVIPVQSLPRSVCGGHPSDCTTAIQEQAPTYEAAAVNSVISFCRTDLSPWEASASSCFQAFTSLSSQPERPDILPNPAKP